MSPRVELQVTRISEPIVVGRHANGGWSLYFGVDPVFHFDGDAQLRRAFVGDKLLRSQGTTLAELTRKRNEQGVHLLRHDQSPSKHAAFMQSLQNQIQVVLDDLQARTAVVLRCDSDIATSVVLDELQRFLQRVLDDGPQLSPPIPGKR